MRTASSVAPELYLLDRDGKERSAFLVPELLADHPFRPSLTRLRIRGGAVKLIALLTAAASLAPPLLFPTRVRADEAGYLSTSGLYDQRFRDAVSTLDFYKPLGRPGASLRPYAAWYGTRDSPTSGGADDALPVIAGDNYFLGAVGVQYTRPYGLRAYVQLGLSAPLGTVPALRSGLDIRTGVQEYREWTAARDERNYGNFYGSFSYFSRYDDLIAYGQLEQGHRFASKKNPIELYERVALTLDARSFYYDNLTELTAGVRFHPFGLRGPSIALEEAVATTLRGPLPSDTPGTSRDFHPVVAFGTAL